MFKTFIWRGPCLRILIQVLLLLLQQKTGRFLLFFHYYFSTFHKIKFRIHIDILRHRSFQMDVLIRHVKSKNCSTIIEGDILVQKIKVIKSIFRFPTASLNGSLIKFYFIPISKNNLRSLVINIEIDSPYPVHKS